MGGVGTQAWVMAGVRVRGGEAKGGLGPIFAIPTCPRHHGRAGGRGVCSGLGKLNSGLLTEW